MIVLQGIAVVDDLGSGSGNSRILAKVCRSAGDFEINGKIQGREVG